MGGGAGVGRRKGKGENKKKAFLPLPPCPEKDRRPPEEDEVQGVGRGLTAHPSASGSGTDLCAGAEGCHCDKQNKGQRAHFLYLQITNHIASWTCFV